MLTNGRNGETPSGVGAAMIDSEHPGSATWFSEVETPHVAGSADAVQWDDEADLVVVGYGGAGVCAALEAAERGLRVLAVDRFHGGGATAMNGGVLYAGGGTSIQRAASVADTPADMFNYLRIEVGGVVSDATLRRFCEESPAMLEWMVAHGVRFNERLFAGKTSYPPPDYYLYHSDSTLAAQFAAVARPAARGHRAFMAATKSAVGYGVGLYQPLRDAAAAQGVRFMAKAAARQLVLDTGGRVLGIKVLQIPPASPAAAAHDALERKGTALLLKMPPAFPGAGFFIARAGRLLAQARAIEQKHRVARYIRAHRGVCLSSGGFIFNADMVAQYAPRYVKGMRLGSAGDDGSGIRLGQTAGGATGRMGQISAWRFINPPVGWARGIIVNGKGARFIDETLYGASIGLEMCERHEGKAYLLLDSRLKREVWADLRAGQMLSFQRYPAMLAMLFGSVSAPNLPGLAARCGMDAAVLRQSVTDYNAAAAGQRADPYRKAPADMAVLGAGPYTAVDISIDAKLMPLPVLTLGGLTVDEESGAVLRADGSAVPGLYAAGRTAVGICSNVYVSGLAVADCVFSGRRVAHAVAP